MVASLKVCKHYPDSLKGAKVAYLERACSQAPGLHSSYALFQDRNWWDGVLDRSREDILAVKSPNEASLCAQYLGGFDLR